MPKAIVLGAGMVGSVMAADLAADDDFQVTIADVREENLKAAAARCGDARRPSPPTFPILPRSDALSSRLTLSWARWPAAWAGPPIPR